MYFILSIFWKKIARVSPVLTLGEIFQNKNKVHKIDSRHHADSNATGFTWNGLDLQKLLTCKVRVFHCVTYSSAAVCNFGNKTHEVSVLPKVSFSNNHFWAFPLHMQYDWIVRMLDPSWQLFWIMHSECRLTCAQRGFDQTSEMTFQTFELLRISIGFGFYGSELGILDS